MTNTQKILLVILFLAIIFSGYVWFRNRNDKGDTSSMATSTSTGTTIATGSGNYTIEPVVMGGKSSLPLPDLNRKVTVYAGAKVAPEAVAYAQTKVTQIQTKLKADNKDVNSWTDLGIYQKSGGDYEGALISWKYASSLSPTDYVSLGNIANLYGYILHDNAQAEIYYKKAIETGPNQSYLYIQLTEMYIDVFKDLDKAKATVTQGLSKVPNDSRLLQLQAQLK